MSTLPPEAVEFFTYVLDEARSRGHTIYWGRRGFSIRAALAPGQPLVSVAYGWPNNSFELYVGYLPVPPTEQLAISTELQKISERLALRDNTTLRAVQPRDESLRRAYRFMLHKVEALATPGELEDPQHGAGQTDKAGA